MSPAVSTVESPRADASSSPLLVREKLCRTALSKSGIPGFEYCVNPYTGCSHGCLYCYATFMKKYSGHIEEWGSFVDAKVNLPEALVRDVKHHRPGPTVVGSVCDSYQPVEKEFGLTRRTLEILGRNRYPFRVLTKSSLIVRDIDLLRAFPDCGASVTLTTLSEEARALFEPGASSVKDRIETIRQLVQAGVDASVFIGPILPYFSDSPEQLRAILSTLQAVGVKHVMLDRMNYLGAKQQLIFPLLRLRWPEAMTAFRELLEDAPSYSEHLRQTVLQVSRKFTLEVEIVF